MCERNTLESQCAYLIFIKWSPRILGLISIQKIQIRKIVYIFVNNFFVKDIFYPLEIDRNFLIDIIYPLSANPTKESNILKQLLECVDHFMGWRLKR